MANRRSVEVRAGLVMFGGSALAVYMGGVAQEFLHAVRSSKEKDFPYHDLLEIMDVDFVVDVISGTSAGGINGALLARALATGGSLDHMSTLWREAGDFSALLDWNGDGEPKSLLNGDLFQKKLEEALGRVSGSSPLVPVLDLHLTATDLAGQFWTRKDFLAHTVLGRQHTKYFQLKLRLGQAELHKDDRFLGYNETQNDFVVNNDAAADKQCVKHLAKLGRTTAAFPGMFRPMSWDPAKVYARDPSEISDTREQVWMSDGGMLDNKPFRPALQTIYERAATRQVDRILFYVEPDLDDKALPSAAARSEEPSAFGVLLKLADLKMYQSIQEYLQSLEEHNQVVENVNDLVEKITEQLANEGHPGSRSKNNLKKRLADDPLRKAYFVFRRNQLAADIRQELTRAYQAYRGANPGLPEPKTALSWLPSSEDDEQQQYEDYWGEFLAAPNDDRLPKADTTYIKRKLHFLIEQTARMQAKFAGTEKLKDLLALETKLWELLQVVRQAEWEWWNSDEAVHLFTARTKECRGLLRAGFETIIGKYKEALAKSTLKDTSLKAEEKMEDCMARLGLLNQWDWFDAYDAVLHPLALGSSFGERDQVEWVRISPYDADTILRKEQTDQSPISEVRRLQFGSEKIAGDTLAHFGGFLSARWRANDFMWGRLDTADQIISTLVKMAEQAAKAGATANAAEETKPRYSPEALQSIKEEATKARAKAFRMILAEELDEDGLEILGAYAYARYPSAEPILEEVKVPLSESVLPAAIGVVRDLQSDQEVLARELQAAAERLKQVAAASEARQPTKALLSAAGDQWQRLNATALSRKTVFPRLGTAVGEPLNQKGRKAWLQYLVRGYASWSDMHTYLLNDHLVGRESVGSLHPAVLANTAVDAVQNFGLLVAQSIGKSNLKLPGAVRKAGKWLSAIFVRFRTAIKIFLPRPEAGADDRRPTSALWKIGAALGLVWFLLPLTWWLFGALREPLAASHLLGIINWQVWKSVNWPRTGLIAADILGVLAALLILFPRGLARTARFLSLAGVRTLLLALLAGLVSENPTLRGWADGKTLLGLDLLKWMVAVRSYIPFLLFGLVVYDILLLLARLVTLAVYRLPAARPVSVGEKYRVRLRNELLMPNPCHPPEGILFDAQERLVVSTTDGHVLRCKDLGPWEELGAGDLPKPALGIVNDPWGGYLLVAGDEIHSYDEDAGQWKKLARVWGANCLVALNDGQVIVSSQYGSSLWKLMRNRENRFGQVTPKLIGLWFTPNGLAVDSAEETLYVACLLSGKVLALDLKTWLEPAHRLAKWKDRMKSVVANLGALSYADGVLVLPEGNLAVSTNRGDAFLIDPVRRQVLERVHFPEELTPANLALHPTQSGIWFAGLGRIKWHWRKMGFASEGDFAGSFEFPNTR